MKALISFIVYGFIAATLLFGTGVMDKLTQKRAEVSYVAR